MQQETVSLDNLGSGAAVERWQLALAEALNNIVDPNTSATAKREIILKIAIKPDENRQFSAVEINVQTKLAPITPVKTQIFIGRDAKGNGMACECQFDPRQQNIPGASLIPPAKPQEAAQQ